jgi:hypothetical protein
MARRRRRSGGSQRAKMRSCAKKCKGQKMRAFRACMRKCLKK